MRYAILSLSFFALATFAGATAVQTGIVFEENKNQYPSQVKYKTGIGSGISLFMEKNCFTYVKYDPAQLEKIHDESHQPGHYKKSGTVDLHAFSTRFTGSSPNVQVSASGKKPYYHNYFKGNDPSRWASEVGLYEKVLYSNLYPGIDLEAYCEKNNFKYDFVVRPGADYLRIQMRYEGAASLSLKNGCLVIGTSVGDVIENIPYTYQVINGKKHEVNCSYVIGNDGKTVSFNFPSGYNKNYPLIIDPVLVGATFSGAPASCTTYGHCATYDQQGNIYTGGECFDPGYPTTMGAFQGTFAGMVDLAIAKLNPNASNLLWATYLGGSNSDIPNSLFVHSNGEIYILGATSSNNYPVSVGCFDNTWNQSEDIVITHLNAGGTALVGSTYVGGSGDDGGGWVSWSMNGHDGMRGEIIVDGAGNAWVASFTSSPNFPTTGGAYDLTLDGMWDGCAFRLSPNLSTMQWSTYLGGSGDDGNYGCRLNPAGELFVTGVTGSSNFPSTGGAYDQTFNGGITDGHVTRFNAAGSAVIASTYFGTTDQEISYFMEMDGNGNPYIYGVSSGGNMPVTMGVYSNAAAKNFVTKFDPGLTALTFSTVFGDGAAFYLEPEAFMVDSCENIYMSGFGSSQSYPVTGNALYPTQASAGGGNCYFIVLSKDALTLSYGSFYYGWHVDGGTSRFDPSGAIYQGICIGGGGAPTPSWAWKNNVNAPSWDMYVVKIDFQMAGVNAIAAAAPNDTICVGGTVNFTNNSNGVNYSWDFGDGSPVDTNTAPSHTYNTAGSYTVTLVAIDSNSCIIADTTHLSITVLTPPSVSLGNDTTLCGTPNIPLDAGNPGNTYIWSTGATTQTITATTAGTYWVNVSNGFCSDADTIVIQLLTPVNLGNDTTLCEGQSVLLSSGITGAGYLWNTGATTSSITVTVTGLYYVDVTSGTCTVTDSINVTFIPVPVLNVTPDSTLCPGDVIVLDAGGAAASYLWSNGATTQTITVSNAGTYSVTASNGSCTASGSTTVTAITPISLGSDVSLCNVTSFTLDAGVTGATYTWSTGASTQTISVSSEGLYWVTLDAGGCLLSDTIALTGSFGDGVLYFPNSFTPTGDTKNEFFTGYGTDITYFHLMIFNRWGQLIFETYDQNPGWDGKLNDNLSQEDVYVWKVEYKSKCSGDEMLRKIGHVSVLR